MKHYVRKWHLITSAISGGPGAYTSLRGKQELPCKVGRYTALRFFFVTVNTIKNDLVVVDIAILKILRIPWTEYTVIDNVTKHEVSSCSKDLVD